MQALQSMDLQALGQNPKVLELMRNSRIQAIQAQMLGR
jgi:hypothetical protein